MQMQTRNRILETARRLFNQQGFDRVSMRILAKECGMAVGNLTYYYPHKEDLVAALMQDAFVHTKPEAPIRSFEDVTDQFARMLSTLWRYAFYFMDERFARSSVPHNLEIQGRILEGFSYLQQEGLFSAAFDEKTQSGVLEMLLLTHMTWVRLTLKAGMEPDINGFLIKHWMILKPYLTEKGEAACERMMASMAFQIKME